METKIVPNYDELLTAVDLLLRSLSFFSKSPASAEKIPVGYSALDAAEDITEALDVMQDAVPGYGLNFIQGIKGNNLIKKGKAIQKTMKFINGFKNFINRKV